VLTLLQYGVKNAIAVEGTDVPESVADLTAERTTTAFLDGDRGGDLILRELAQVADVDYVTFAPDGQSVEDLSRNEVFEALRDKVPYDVVADAPAPRSAVAATDGSATPAPETGDERPESTESPDQPSVEDTTTGPPPDDEDAKAVAEAVATSESVDSVENAGADVAGDAADSDEDDASAAPEGDTVDAADADADEESEASPPETLHDHVRTVVRGERATVRLLDEAFETVDEVPLEDAVETVEAASSPDALVVDGELGQRLLDVAAQRGVSQVVARSLGEFTKRPTSVRLRTADQLLGEA
jgi:DNA primase